MIKIEHLQKYFNRGKRSEIHVLNDITLELPQTGLVCILGESGSGKTTLLNTPDGGRRHGQRKAAQRQGIPAAEPRGHPADQERRRPGPGNDVEPVMAQTAVKQQRYRVGVVERKEPNLLQGEIPQPPLQVLQ